MKRIQRLIALMGAICGLFFDAAMRIILKQWKAADRADWQSRSAQRLLDALDIDWRCRGVVPKQGLLLCNHLSYLDILLIAASMPCRFISKMEVKSWPVFGWMASLGGTIYVDRDSRMKVQSSNREIEKALLAGELLVLFPEGTSSGGEDVLMFKSSLFQAPVSLEVVSTPAALGYALHDGLVDEEVCYWGDMTLMPHLMNLLGHNGLDARLVLGQGQMLNGVSRKFAAARMEERVRRLYRQVRPSYNAVRVVSEGSLQPVPA